MKQTSMLTTDKKLLNKNLSRKSILIILHYINLIFRINVLEIIAKLELSGKV